MPYILDTNTLGALWQYGQSHILGQRLAAIPDPKLNIRVTIITFQEMLGGRLLDLRRDPKNVTHLRALHLRYELLAQTFQRLRDYYPPLPFDQDAQSWYEKIPRAIRTNALDGDCKIASIAVQQNCTVITANVKDFARISEAIPVQYEDWTIVPME